MIGRTCVFMAIAVFLFISAVHADIIQKAPAGLEEMLFEEIPTVISSTLIKQKISEAPSAMSVMSAEEIRKRGYRTLKDMVADIPGWEDVSDANEVIAAIRGMYASTTNKILVMINGHRMNDLNLGRYNLDQFLGTDVIERVEFIKGPGSVLYGNGALIGVINVITKKGSDIKGIYVSQKNVFYEDNKDYETGITLGDKKGDFDVLFNFTSLEAQGDEIVQPPELDNPPGGTAKQGGEIYYNKYPKNWSIFSSIIYDDMHLDIRREHYARATPRSPNISYYDWNNEIVKPQYQEDITYLDLKYNLAISADSKLTLNPSVTAYRLEELSWISTWAANYLPTYGTRSGQKTKYEQWQFKAIYENQLKDNMNLILGYDTIFADFHDMYGVTGTTGDPFTITQTDQDSWVLAGGFYQLLYSPIDPLEFTIAGRYDTFENFSDPRFTKRLGAVYKIREGLIAKLLYGEAFLSPQWAHIKRVTAGAWTSNPSLKAENFEGWDFIIEYNRRKTHLNLSIFRNRLENLISAVGTSYFNLGENTYQGFELEEKHKLSEELELQGSYSLVVDEGNSSDSYLISGEIKNIPQHIYRFGLKYAPVRDLDILLWGRAYNSVLTSDTITGERKIKDWVTMDMSVNYKVKDVDFQLGVTNVFDQYYEVGGSVNRPLARPCRGIRLSAGCKF